MSFKRSRAESDADIGDLVKRRRFYTIPKDQRKILDRGGSAYHKLKERQDGIRGNIPPGVLDGVRAQYSRNRAAERKTETSEINDKNENALSKGTGAIETNLFPSAQSIGSRTQLDSAQSSTPQNLPSRPPSSSPGRSISWSPSPTRHRLQSVAIDAPKTVGETPAALHNPRDITSPGARSHAKIDYDNFPSSDGAEDELEVDIPAAQESPLPAITASGIYLARQASSPLKQISLVQNTPPCAQPPPAIIPSTLDQRVQVADPRGDRPRGKARWMPVPAFSDDIASDRAENTKVRMPNTKLFNLESSDSTQSSMVVPATLEPLPDNPLIHSHPVQSHPRALKMATVGVLRQMDYPVADAIPENALEFKSGHHAEHGLTQNKTGRPKEPYARPVLDAQERQVSQSTAKDVFLTQAPMTQDRGPLPAAATVDLAADPGMQVDIPEAPQLSDNTLKEGEDPYQHFTRVYPDYEPNHNGGLVHFVRAAAVLESLRSQMALKSALYDDFVRAFSDGYLSYVKETGPDRESQPAFEWYNWKDEPVMFAQGVLNQKNLDYVKLAYPARFAEAKKLLSDEIPEARISCDPSEAVRETIELGEAEEAEDGANLALWEPKRPVKHKTNGAYLAPKHVDLKIANDDLQSCKWDNEVDLGSEEYVKSPDRPRRWKSSPLGLCDAASHNGVSIDRVRMTEQRTPKTDSLSAQRSHQLPPSDQSTKAVGKSREKLLADDLAAVAHSTDPSAFMHSAGPSSNVRLGKRVVSAPMGPPRSLANTSRASSNAPPSSSIRSVRRVSSSVAPHKPRPSGVSYLQRLKLKGGNDEAREARMRELGRVKRKSRGASVTSSHTSSK